MMNKPEWASDPRYDNLHKRRACTQELTREIEALFAAHDFAHWKKALDEHGLIWAPVAQLPDVIDDPQVQRDGLVHRPSTTRRSASSKRSTRRSRSTARTSERAARRPKQASTPSRCWRSWESEKRSWRSLRWMG